MAPPTPASRWVRANSVVWRRLPDGVLLFPPRADDPFAITGPGALIWDLLAEVTSIDDLVTALATRYGTDAELVRADTEPVIEQLQLTGAIVAGTTS